LQFFTHQLFRAMLVEHVYNKEQRLYGKQLTRTLPDDHMALTICRFLFLAASKALMELCPLDI